MYFFKHFIWLICFDYLVNTKNSDNFVARCRFNTNCQFTGSMAVISTLKFSFVKHSFVVVFIYRRHFYKYILLFSIFFFAKFVLHFWQIKVLLIKQTLKYLKKQSIKRVCCKVFCSLWNSTLILSICLIYAQ